MRGLVGFLFLASAQVGCSGDVIDKGSSSTSSTSTTGGSGAGGSASMPLSCGDTPPVGQIVTACIPMDGDFCLPAANSPGLLVDLAKAKGVCAETSPTACCDKPAYRQVVCDQLPGVNDCCYDVHFIEKVVCP